MAQRDLTARIGAYFDEISSWSGAYKSPTLVYFGIEVDGVIELCTARVRLQFKKPLPDSSQRIGRLYVGSVPVRNCVAIYDDRAHHSAWIGDPKEFQNPRLTALDACSCGLEVLKSYLLPTDRRGAAARHFEAAVSWALWSYGLSTAYVGNTDLSKEGPDILATAPNGGIAVVECTLGLLKEESKLAKVARRAVSIRDRLSTAGLHNVEVLPILVTNLARREIEAELDAATEAGVLVLTRENLESALREILVFPDGDQTFKRGVEALQLAKEELNRKRNQGYLPGM